MYWSKKWSLAILVYFSLCSVQYHKPWITLWVPCEVPLMVLKVLPWSREKSWHNKKKLNCLICNHRLRSSVAHHFKISELIQCKDFFLKGDLWSCYCSYTTRHKNTTFLKNIFYLQNAPLWVQGCYKKDIHRLNIAYNTHKL